MLSKNIFHSFQEIFQPNILRNYPGYFAMQVNERHAQSFGLILNAPMKSFENILTHCESSVYE